MRKPLIAANWKMNGDKSFNKKLLTELIQKLPTVSSAEFLVCPPFVYCESVAELLQNSQIYCGGQNLSEFNSGAYTGDVSAEMLIDVGCRYVLIGHSERRSLFGENNDIISRKILRALNQNLIPVICLGENLEQRQQGLTEKIVISQLNDALHLTENHPMLHDAVLAYEPVWAIGTGLTATPEQAQEVHAILRAEIAKYDRNWAQKIRIIYGGSVKANNAQGLFNMPDIDGFLVGGASLVAEEFLSICKVVE